MTQHEHETLLSDTKRSEGRMALRNNVAAASALADAVRSTLGPRGLDKMLVSEGDVLVTNDGVTVLQNAKVEHPTARMLIDQSTAQDTQAGDGTTTTVILTAELLQNALELTERGVHPSIIGRGFRMAWEACESGLGEIARPMSEEQHLQAVQTSLAGKSDEGIRAHLSNLAVEAALSLSDEVDGVASADASLVKVVTDRGKQSTASELVHGLVLPKEKIHPQMELLPKGGRIMLLDGGISRRKPEVDINLKVTDLGMLAALNERELADVQKRVDAISALGVDLLCVRDGIDDDARGMLYSAGITAYRRLERPDLELLSRATGATLVHEISLAVEDDLGEFSSLSETNWHGVNHLLLVGSQSRGLTLVVRGTSNTRIEEIERCFEDALQVACNLVESPQLLPGGGATQMALARRLRRHAETVPGREQLAIEAFAAALDSIPRILAENAGLSSLDESIRLNAAQDEGGDWIGLDLFTGEPRDMAEAGIVEPLLVTRHAIEGATEAAISVLRIDDVLWAEQDAQEPDWNTDDSDED